LFASSVGFGTGKAPHLVEWLSDNGSAYIAKDTLDTATALGLQLCFTPVRSPESNGIAEAFVKTFKRDYARLSILPDAATVIALEFLRLSAYRNQAACPVKRGAHQVPSARALTKCASGGIIASLILSLYNKINSLS
jgi:transposase InsO family protein